MERNWHQQPPVMGLTVVQKSERRTPGGRRSRIALVLAGGSLTGAAYELGVLRGLESALADTTAIDFDIYVGVSAGAYVAAPLAGGISPARMLATLERSAEFEPAPDLRLGDLNAGDLFRAPLRYLRDLLLACAGRGRRAPSAASYLPLGFFNNDSLERYLRENMARGGATNDFVTLRRERGVDLYVVATRLATAERVIFGHDEDASVTISEAVQASTALPGVFAPVRLGGVDYVDGAVHHTADVDVAVRHGADLVLCLNPLRPLQPSGGAPAGTPAEVRGFFALMNQVMRAMVHSRLHLQLRQLAHDPSFHGDVVLIEPPAGERALFDLGSFGVPAARAAADYGYRTVRRMLRREGSRLSALFARHGLVLRDPGDAPAGSAAMAPARLAS